MAGTSPDKKHPIKKTSLLIWAISLALLYSLSFIFLTSHLLRISPITLLTQFKNSLFMPNTNLCFIGKISGVDAMFLFYTFLLPALILATAFQKLYNAAPPPQDEISKGAQPSVMICLIGLLLFAGIQQMHRFDYFWSKKGLLGKTTEEKKLMFFGDRYKLVRNCRQVLNGSHRGKLISDYDMETDKHMYLHRLLSYLFYPKVSLTIENKAPNDVILAIHKKDAFAYMPKDYRVLLATKDQNFVLALKDRSEK